MELNIQPNTSTCRVQEELTFVLSNPNGRVNW